MSNFFSCWLGLGVGWFLGGVGLGGGCFFCFGGRVGIGDFGLIDGFEGDFGVNGLFLNKLFGFWKGKILVKCFIWLKNKEII